MLPAGCGAALAASGAGSPNHDLVPVGVFSDDLDRTSSPVSRRNVARSSTESSLADIQTTIDLYGCLDQPAYREAAAPAAQRWREDASA